MFDLHSVDNKTAIFRYIQKQPGAYYSQIRKELNLAPGVSSHHLKKLKEARLVESRSDGYLTRYYPCGFKYVPVSLTPKQMEVVEVITRKQGITNRELCSMFGKTQQTMFHHVKNLIEKGVVRKEERDRKWFLYPSSSRP